MGGEQHDAPEKARKWATSQNLPYQNTIGEGAGKVWFTHLGQVNARQMALLQKYSTYLIIEGNNTWQETLTIGTPALSTKPRGDTQPWIHNFQNHGQAAQLVRDASAEIVGAGKTNIGTRNWPKVDDSKLCTFIMDVESDDSKVKNYMLAWQKALRNPVSDQFTCALAFLDRQILQDISKSAKGAPR